MNRFFGCSCRDSHSVEFEQKFTLLQIPEKDEKGRISISTKVLEAVIDPLSTLKFSDYSLNAMLAAGVPFHAIHITPDVRIGSDKEIKAFNERVDKLAEKMFNIK